LIFLKFCFFRLEKSGEKSLSNDEIRVIVEKIEEEMYRVYGKVDNSYKNKFRSLLANISNMNNNVNIFMCLLYLISFFFFLVFL
jgi:DUF4097 and DUF4098 domain-containing protein YvlB